MLEKNVRARTEGRSLERPATCTVQYTKPECCSRSGRVASAWPTLPWRQKREAHVEARRDDSAGDRFVAKSFQNDVSLSCGL
jgi:hypothetical protein